MSLQPTFAVGDTVKVKNAEWFKVPEESATIQQLACWQADRGQWSYLLAWIGKQEWLWFFEGDLERPMA